MTINFWIIQYLALSKILLIKISQNSLHSFIFAASCIHVRHLVAQAQPGKIATYKVTKRHILGLVKVVTTTWASVHPRDVTVKLIHLPRVPLPLPLHSYHHQVCQASLSCPHKTQDLLHYTYFSKFKCPFSIIYYLAIRDHHANGNH